MDRLEAEESWELLEKEEIDEIKEKKEKIRYFFNMFDDIFDTEIKKMIFLEGVISEYFFNKQNLERGETPLKEDLNGLNLDEKQIMELLPLIQKRLEKKRKSEYERQGSIIRKCFDKEGRGWGMTNGEIGFYYVLGMNFSHFF